MSISVACPHCGKKIKAPDNLAGKTARCPSCQRTFLVPANIPAPPSVPQASREAVFSFDRPEQVEENGPFEHEDVAGSTPPGPERRNSFVDYLLFRKMVAPVIIQVLFWFGVAGAIMAGLAYMGIGISIMKVSVGMGVLTMLGGLAEMVIGPLLVRVYCELLIVIFRIYEKLTEINERLAQRSGS
jgi:hypothetical protein